MHNRPREYHRPSDLNTALELLSQPDTQPLVFGPRVPLAPFANVEHVVDLSGLNLRYIKESDGLIHIGAQTSLQDLGESPLLRSYANGILAEAAALSAGLGLRHLATLGGALTFRTGPPDIRLALMALRANAVVRTTGQNDQYEIGLASDWEPKWPHHLLIELKLERRPAPYAGAFVHLARTPKDQAILAAAATVQVSETPRGRTRETYVYIGPNPHTGTGAVELPDRWGTQADVVDMAIKHLELEGKVSSDFRAGAAYRAAMAQVLTRRAIETAWQRAGLA